MLAYCAAGALYVLVKVAFVAWGYLHPGAIWHGAIPAAATLLAGVAAQAWCKQGKVPGWSRRVLVALPVLIFTVTPVFMYLKQGADRWLTEGRMPVLVIYEFLALAQLALAWAAVRHGQGFAEPRTRAPGPDGRGENPDRRQIP
jgi:cell division protein FtsW (lipid II flippase)